MSLSELPKNLPVPVDDGAARHLLGAVLPNLTLKATHGTSVTIDSIAGFLVIYIYPMTGRPDVQLPDGWEEIPGARGCTPNHVVFATIMRSCKNIKLSSMDLVLRQLITKAKQRNGFIYPLNY